MPNYVLTINNFLPYNPNTHFSQGNVSLVSGIKAIIVNHNTQFNSAIVFTSLFEWCIIPSHFFFLIKRNYFLSLWVYKKQELIIQQYQRIHSSVMIWSSKETTKKLQLVNSKSFTFSLSPDFMWIILWSSSLDYHCSQSICKQNIDFLKSLIRLFNRHNL